MIETLMLPEARESGPDPWLSPDVGGVPARLDCSEVLLWCDRFRTAGLPGEEAALVDLLRAAEDLKSAAAAVQARAAVALEAARVQAEADQGVPKSRRGAGVGVEVALARRESPFRGGRLLGLRPLPDGMVQLTAILGLTEGVAAYAVLKKAADRQAGSLDESGEPRGRGVVMAEELVARITGRTAATPSGVDLTVVMTDEALLGETDEPAHVEGYGPVAASWVRRLVGGLTDESQRVVVRRLFRKPGRLVQLESVSRLMPPALKHLIRIRDQVCRSPWCGAPIRHADHVVAHEQGGPTSLANGQGLCEACNYTKQQGWTSTPSHHPGQGHIVTLTTPTGHIYTSTQPGGPL